MQLKKASGVEVLDAETNKTYEYKAKIIFLNASTFNSAWVLMNSATDIWPEGLGSSSGQLGHNVMDHHFRCGASGKMEGYEDKYYYGRRPNGIYIPRFRNIYEDKRDYVRGFGYQGSASRDGWNREIAETILPETKTPGEKDAAVGEFMKIMVNDCYTPKDQKVFHEGIKKLDEACKKMYNMGFMDITPGQRHDLFLTTKTSKGYRRRAIIRDLKC